jgi:glutaconate CoA-transferase, subunit A
VQSFGLLGDTLEGANASRRIICTVEEIVPRETIRGVPDRTIIPGFRVSSVSVVPWGAYPSYVDGIYGRDDEAYAAWDKLSRSESELGTWIDTEIRQHASFADYVAGIGDGRLAELECRGREGPQ